MRLSDILLTLVHSHQHLDRVLLAQTQREKMGILSSVRGARAFGVLGTKEKGEGRVPTLSGNDAEDRSAAAPRCSALGMGR